MGLVYVLSYLTPTIHTSLTKLRFMTCAVRVLGDRDYKTMILWEGKKGFIHKIFYLAGICICVVRNVSVGILPQILALADDGHAFLVSVICDSVLV